jgi:glycosyltransferase involved in cell wall biosynthesis
MAMPADVEVRILHVGQPQVFKRLSQKKFLQARRWQPCSPNVSERWVIIPGWNKFPRVSTWLALRAVASAVDDRASTALVLALPQYAGVAEGSNLRPRVYYAHDPFEFYDWNKDQTRALESRMLKSTEMTFAISRLLREDLAPRTDHPVYYSPNATGSAFIDRMREGNEEFPRDLEKIRHPLVGIIGRINETYDWPMLDKVTASLPEVSFLFIGGIEAGTEAVRKTIDAILKGRPNVHWLGLKWHAALPGYLAAFDVCLNPLAPGPHSDRRSPLRLYDFLATGKPVISTRVAEALMMGGQVWVGNDADEIISHIRAALSGARQVEPAARIACVNQNTWAVRAQNLLEKIDPTRAQSQQLELVSAGDRGGAD